MLLILIFVGVTKAEIGLNISKCPFEFLVGEDVNGCKGIQDHLHNTTNVLLESVCPYQSPYINFDRAEQNGIDNLNGEVKWLKTRFLRQYMQNIIRNAGIQLTRKISEECIGYRLDYVRNTSCGVIRNSTNLKLNRMCGTYPLNFKSALSRMLLMSSNKYGRENYPFLLPAFALPKRINQFKQYLMENKKDNIMEKWMMKPSGLARAKKLQIVTEPEHVDKYRAEVYNRTTIAQKYMNEPMLYKGRKVVSRVYVYITSRIPLRIYILKEGHSFVALQNYTDSIDEINNHCIHVPLQSAIIGGNKNCKNSESLNIKSKIQLEDEYGMMSSEYFTYLSSEYDVNITQLWTKIEDMVLKTMLLLTEYAYIKEKKCLPFPYNSYGELSFEYIIDSNANPFLIEVNEIFALFATPRSFNMKNDVVKKGMTLGGFQPPPSYIKKYGLPSSLSYDYKENKEELKSKIETVENMRNSTLRADLLRYILDNLTEWDVRELLIGEDELLRSVGLKRLFPKRSTLEPYEKYLKTKFGKYSLLLQEAWETRYGGLMDRKYGIKFLKNKCSILI